jgi:translation initiation factor IF-3
MEDKTISNSKEQLVNEAIRVPSVRVIANDGEQLGILKTQDALRIAYDKGLDLVMVASQSDPPVCKIIDYGKYCFERDKREKEAKKKQTIIEIKELQLTCKIGQHDIDTKLKHARRFIGDGNKVRVVVKFRGREMQHTEIGYDLMNSFLEALSDVASADKQPVLEGYNLTVTISPIKNK